MNVSIHGIDERKVKGSPNFKAIFPDLARKIGGHVVATHTAFDRSAVAKAISLYRSSTVPAAVHGACDRGNFEV
ncbi:hypothetical protein J8I34_33035, partial [Cupriavidus sp. AcVe19-6a]|nr:hypothetical protein [Cupriavidus sp. AcVe19-6a]